MSHNNSDGVPVVTHEKEVDIPKQATPVQPPRSRLSIPRLIVGASVAVGLAASSWRNWKSLDSSVVNEEVLVVPQLTPRLDTCPGYSAGVVETTSTGLTAHLHLFGDGCNIYAPDIQTILLTVTYETSGSHFHSFIPH